MSSSADLGVAPAPVLSPWSEGRARVSVGVFSLAFLFAFESIAVATVMPGVARDLDGLSWYPVAFAAPLAAAVVALAGAGAAADRRGPGPVLRSGVAVFCLGLVLAAAAPTMPLLVLGRLVHGYGGGIIGVALYVLVARAYPAQLRPRVFALLTTAWVLPALVGPSLAAGVAHVVGWRWVFGGVPVLALLAWGLVARAARAVSPLDDDPPRSDAGRRRIDAALRPALAVAAGIGLLALAGQRPFWGWPALLPLGVAAVVLGARRVLPPRAWSLDPGLPVVLGTRAAVGTAFLAAEVYVPLLLGIERGLSLGQAGLVLSVGAITWSAGAMLAARWVRLADEAARVRLGTTAVALGVTGFATVAVDAVPLVVPVVAWGVAGLGVGMAFSTLSVLALATAAAGEEGRTSSALQVNDQIAGAVVTAVGGVVFAALAASSPGAAATGLVVAAGALAAAGLVPAARLVALAPAPVGDDLSAFGRTGAAQASAPIGWGGEHSPQGRRPRLRLRRLAGRPSSR